MANILIHLLGIMLMLVLIGCVCPLKRAKRTNRRKPARESPSPGQIRDPGQHHESVPLQEHTAPATNQAASKVTAEKEANNPQHKASLKISFPEEYNDLSSEELRMTDYIQAAGTRHSDSPIIPHQSPPAPVSSSSWQRRVTGTANPHIPSTSSKHAGHPGGVCVATGEGGDVLTEGLRARATANIRPANDRDASVKADRAAASSRAANDRPARAKFDRAAANDPAYGVSGFSSTNGNRGVSMRGRGRDFRADLLTRIQQKAARNIAGGSDNDAGPPTPSYKPFGQLLLDNALILPHHDPNFHAPRNGVDGGKGSGYEIGSAVYPIGDTPLQRQAFQENPRMIVGQAMEMGPDEPSFVDRASELRLSSRLARHNEHDRSDLPHRATEPSPRLTRRDEHDGSDVPRVHPQLVPESHSAEEIKKEEWMKKLESHQRRSHVIRRGGPLRRGILRGAVKKSP